MEKKLKVVVYLRCSTSEQSTDMQLSELNEYAAARGLTVQKIYQDQRTGTNTNRPAFQQMMKDARSRKFNLLLIWKLDRFARSLRDLLSHLQELTELGITFVSLKDQLDLGSSVGRLMLQIVGAFGEFEASIIRERVRAGVRNKIAKTGKWGPSRKRDDQAIRKLRETGLSVREIARRQGVSSTSVARAIKGVPGTLAKVGA